MKTHFCPDRVLDVIVCILTRYQGSANWSTIRKLLYLIDRKTLQEYCYPVVGSGYMSGHEGPAISDNLEGWLNSAEWKRFIAVSHDGDRIHLFKLTDQGELSPAEEDAIDQVIWENFPLTRCELIDKMQSLPEWENPGDLVALPLTAEAIMRAGGISEEDVGHAVELIDYMHAFDEAFHTKEGRYTNGRDHLARFYEKSL